VNLIGGDPKNTKPIIWKFLPPMYRRCQVEDIVSLKHDELRKGNVLVWKHLSEIYLIRQCIPFTIIHSSQITNEPGGKHPVIWDTDDYLMYTGKCAKFIPAEDVADCLISTLYQKHALNRAIDITTDLETTIPPKQDGRPSEGVEAMQDWELFWSIPGNCLYAQTRVGTTVDSMKYHTTEASEDMINKPTTYDEEVFRNKQLDDGIDDVDIEDS
jgi:hypothetical protein